MKLYEHLYDHSSHFRFIDMFALNLVKIGKIVVSTLIKFNANSLPSAAGCFALANV